jgi:N-glycosylase/DNA lyase
MNTDIKIHLLSVTDFSIEQIALSGQCFRINKVQAEGINETVGFFRQPLGAAFEGIDRSLVYCDRINAMLEKHGTKCIVGDALWSVHALGRELLIISHPDGTHTFCCSADEYQSVWVPYFDLNRDYSKIKRRILELNDPYLAEAVKFGWGLRILQQDIWEVLISFIISQRNNIPRIKTLIENLCVGVIQESCAANFGNTLRRNKAGRTACSASFPSPHVLAQLPGEFFMQIGLGYRARYVKSAAIAVSTGELDLSSVQQMLTYDAIDYLKKFSGIGDKVAHCVALFGLHRLDAFPRDVWINRIIAEHFHDEFSLDKIHDIAGIVQQYMFFFERRAKLKA